LRPALDRLRAMTASTLPYGKLTPRQEAFAAHVARGVPYGEAYRLAGYRSVDDGSIYANASRLAKDDRIKTRIDNLLSTERRLRERAQEATLIVTAQTVTAMLAQAYEAALKHKQIGAAATAAMGLAKLHGLLVDKTEDVTRLASRDPDAPREIEIEGWLAEQAPLLGLASPKPEPANGAANPAGTVPGAPHGAPLPGSPDVDDVCDMGLGAPEPRSPEAGAPLGGSAGLRDFVNDINGLGGAPAGAPAPSEPRSPGARPGNRPGGRGRGPS